MVMRKSEKNELGACEKIVKGNNNVHKIKKKAVVVRKSEKIGQN